MTIAPALPVAERLALVHDRIRRAGGDPGRVRVVAVTKGFGPAAVASALAAGIGDLGENYAQELVAKATATGELTGEWTGRATAEPDPDSDPGIVAPSWHFLGRVQRNKVAGMARHVGLWQAVDRIGAGREIARRSPGSAVLVQVSVPVSGPARPGCPPSGVPELVEQLSGLGLVVRGLMAVGPRADDKATGEAFRMVGDLADRLGLPERSMGMTDDLEVAVAEGATIVRVGRALFGERPSKGATWWAGGAHHGAQ